VALSLLAIGSDSLALEPLVAAVSEHRGAHAGADGAVATFLGLVRNHNKGRRVRYLEYEAY
jgi:molybdopterin synthase catalytic subunit